MNKNNQKKQRYAEYYLKGQRVLPSQDGLGQVWLSGYDFAINFDQLKRNKIEAICSAANLGLQYPQAIDHITFNLMDTHTQSLQQAFSPSFQFIQEKRKKTNVLIHCAAGISRSASLVIAYMIKKYRKKYIDCVNTLKIIRPCVQPNINFVNQLLKYQLAIKKQGQVKDDEI